MFKDEIDIARNQPQFLENYVLVKFESGKFKDSQKKERNELKQWVRSATKGKDCFGSIYYRQGHLSGLLIMKKSLFDHLKNDAPLGQISFDKLYFPPSEEFEVINGSLEEYWINYSQEITDKVNFTFII